MTTTDLCVLKVIIYRILQLPQFLLFFLLFFFLFLRQSSLSLVIIVILVYLWCEGNKKKTLCLQLRHQGSENRAPHNSQHATDTGAPGVFTWEIHVLVTAYLHST